MSDITQLLERWSRGDRDAFQALLPLVYEELRRLAARHFRLERPGHLLQPTALVHEAYLRLAGLREARLTSRAHFYGAAAQVMRRVLVDHARERRAVKRGGPEAVWVTLDDTLATPDGEDAHIDLIALDTALLALAARFPDRAKVVELRYFGGLSVEETASFLKRGANDGQATLAVRARVAVPAHGRRHDG